MAQPSQPQPSSEPSRHYLTQAGIAASFAALLRLHWGDLSRDEMYALLVRFSQGSATLSAQDYSRRRTAAGIKSRFTVPLAEPATREHFDKTLNWVYDNTKSGAIVVDLEADARKKAEAALPRLAVQAGRETTVAAVEADPKARAWARETRPGCCYFCALLASRGAVYSSADSAGREANAKFKGGGEFKFHNNCHCIAVPVFGVYEPTADARQWAAEWQRLKDEHGKVSLDMWREHFEGRLKDTPQ